MSYDSRPDTKEHINRVRQLLDVIKDELHLRGLVHDASKLESPEVEIFDEYTPKLRDSTYGSDEYKKFLEGMKVGLDHHYANNRHHPEYHKYGIFDMSLLDLIEMLADWKAATERHENGDLDKSITINAERFGYQDHALENILRRTAFELGWL